MQNDISLKVLALDVGDIRVGMAEINSVSHRPTPLQTTLRADAEGEILRLIRECGYNLLVVGLPLSSENKQTVQSEKVKRFCRRITRRIVIRVVFEDEYLSSEEAFERLGVSGMKSRAARRKGAIDAEAAVIILERYLERTTQQRT